MDERGPILARMHPDRYVEYLIKHGIEPNDEERAGSMYEMKPGEEVSLNHADQRSTSPREGSAK